MNNIQKIKDILDEVAFEYSKPFRSNTEWTKEIKSRLCELGRNCGFKTYSSACEHSHGGEWLYDITWIRYLEKRIVELAMVAECEWLPSLSDISDDFQKLLQAKSDIKVMIFHQTTLYKFNKISADLKQQVQVFEKSDSQETYLLSCWLEETRKFFHEIYQFKSRT